LRLPIAALTREGGEARMHSKQIHFLVAVLFSLGAAIHAQGISLGAGVRTYFLYKGYLAVFTPAVQFDFDIPISDGLSAYGSADLVFGFEYFAENIPRDFFLEYLCVLTGLRYAAGPVSEWRFLLDADLDFKELWGHSSLTPRIEWKGSPADAFSLGGGLGFRFFPGDAMKNTAVFSYELNGDCSGFLPWEMRISYEGEFGIRLNDYNYKSINPAPENADDLFSSSGELKPYLGYYGERLSLDFPICDAVSIRYQVGNRFVFFNRFPNGNPVLTFSPEETLQSLLFALDVIFTY
jgi:hypothetical protein